MISSIFAIFVDSEFFPVADGVLIPSMWVPSEEDDILVFGPPVFPVSQLESMVLKTFMTRASGSVANSLTIRIISCRKD